MTRLVVIFLASCALAEEAPHWAYQPLTTKPGTSIDDFILTRLQEHHLTPAPEAEPATLIRRLHFDLTGLPPSPHSSSQPHPSYSETIDTLLASPAFAERWARHWLDVARFAESNGRESNLTYPHAWRYRDYVIDAFKNDIPFDRFITEQIAGDLLPAKDDAERARLLIATGFLTLGAKGLNEQNKAQFAADLADEQLDTVTRSVLGSSIACARCHDHKTDPFRMEDYYGLAGIFKSTQTHFGTWIDSENNNGSHLVKLPTLPGQLVPNKSIPLTKVSQLKSDLAKLNQEEKEQQEYAIKAKLEGRDISGEYFKMLQNAIRIIWTRGGIEGQLETVDDNGRALPLCMGVQDSNKPADSPLFERGELTRPGKTIPRAIPSFLPVKPINIPTQQSGRLELAQWLSSPQNPLTARVLANRIWKHLLGTGLVRTVDDFGTTGEAPSHPELLDYLAQRLVASKWSIKALIKEIVLSKTYRQRSSNPKEIDPDNRFLAHANKRRLDAEVIRDSMLAISGQLDTNRRPASLVSELDGQSVSLIGFNTKLPPDLDGSSNRSIYLPILRDNLPDVLEQFDFANPNLVTGNRDTTNVPLQALYLLNGPFVRAQATALAQRLIKEHSTISDRIHRAYALCFNRAPDTKEHQLAQTFLTAQSGTELELTTAYCQSLLSTAEFRIAD